MFQRIVLDLIEAGLSEQEIAQAVGTSQPSINRIKLGKQGKSGVKYELGVKLIELHREKVQGEPPQASRRRPPAQSGRGAAAVSSDVAKSDADPSAETASVATGIVAAVHDATGVIAHGATVS